MPVPQNSSAILACQISSEAGFRNLAAMAQPSQLKHSFWEPFGLHHSLAMLQDQPSDQVGCSHSLPDAQTAGDAPGAPFPPFVRAKPLSMLSPAFWPSGSLRKQPIGSGVGSSSISHEIWHVPQHDNGTFHQLFWPALCLIPAPPLPGYLCLQARPRLRSIPCTTPARLGVVLSQASCLWLAFSRLSSHMHNHLLQKMRYWCKPSTCSISSFPIHSDSLHHCCLHLLKPCFMLRFLCPRLSIS